MKRVSVLLLAAALTCAGCYTNPVTGRKSLVLLSQGEEVTLGAQSFQEIRQKEKVSSDPAYNARVTRVAARLEVLGHRPSDVQERVAKKEAGVIGELGHAVPMICRLPHC